jgi:hypothetical protein
MNVYIMIILSLSSIIRDPIRKGTLGFKGLSGGLKNSIRHAKCSTFFQVVKIPQLLENARTFDVRTAGGGETHVGIRWALINHCMIEWKGLIKVCKLVVLESVQRL